jgi:hypothetical protein
LENLIKTLYTNKNDSEKKTPMFVASIPYFNYTQDYCLPRDEGSGWFGNHSISEMTNQQVEDYINGLVKTYNDAIEPLVEKLQSEGYNVHFVDVNSVVNKNTDLYDGCHPNKSGSTKIANAFAEAINSYYLTAGSGTSVGTIKLNNDNNWMGSLDIADGDANDTYYVVENPSLEGWDVSYSDNLQKVNSGQMITVTNTRNIPKTELTVEKTWVNDSADTDGRSKISLVLQRRIEDGEWVDTTVDMPTKVASSDGNVWTYTYTNLPTEDNSGNKYYYRVTESAMDGYTVVYDSNYANGLKAVENASAGTLKITNTRMISLKLQKIWSDPEESHTGDTVTLVIHRATSEESVPDSVKDNIDLQAFQTAATMTANETAEVTVNKTGTTVTFDDDSIASATVNERTITITGLTVGETTMHITDGKTTVDVKVTVKPEPVLSLAIDKTSIYAGETATLTPSIDDGSSCDGVVYTVVEGNSSDVRIDGNTVTALNSGTFVIKATLNGRDSNTVTLESTWKPLSPLTGENKVFAGSTIQLTNPNYGTFEYSATSDNGGSVTITPNNDGTITVQGGEVGTVTITATRIEDNATLTYDVTVAENVELFIYNSVGTDVTGNTMQAGVGMTYTFTTNRSISSVSSSNNYFLSVQKTGDKEFKVTGVYTANWTLTITVTDSDNTQKYIYYSGVVASPSITLTSNNGTTVDLGNTLQLTCDTEGVTYTSSDESIATVNSNGVVTASSDKTGTVTITASKDGYTSGTITIKVKDPSAPSFLISSTANDYTATLSSSVSAGNVVITFDNLTANLSNSLAIELYDSNSNRFAYMAVSTDANGSVSSVTNWGNSGADPYHDISCDASKNTVSFTLKSGATKPTLNMVKFLSTGGTLDVVSITVDGTPITLKTTQSLPHRQSLSAALSLSAETLSLLSDDGAEGTTAAASDDTSTPTFDENGTYTVTLKAINDWQCTLENLPTQDSDGNPYYYWVEETPVSNYTASYSFDDADDNTLYCINAQQVGNGVMTITNTKENTEDEGYNLPSTGGTGTKPYRLAGLFLMGGGCALTFATQFTRRRRKKCTK